MGPQLYLSLPETEHPHFGVLGEIAKSVERRVWGALGICPMRSYGFARIGAARLGSSVSVYPFPNAQMVESITDKEKHSRKVALHL